MQLSVILPCYNEEENIARVPKELVPVLDQTGLVYEIIVVDDGSKDQTVAKARGLNLPRLRVVEHGVNQGLGSALRTGIENANGEWLIFLDTDFTFHPNLIPRLLRAKETNPQADFIIGSPNLGGYDNDIPKWRLAISRVANSLYHVLLGKPITSINQIFRLYRTQDLKALSLSAIGFDINAEILFKLVFTGKTFVEVPAELTQRIYGVSKLNYYKEIRRHFILMGRIIKWKWLGM